jgi:putative Mg2+ transporter-C (MgtC) family protein
MVAVKSSTATAAVGACAGAGLPILAVVTTGIYFVVAIGFPEITKRLPRSSTATSVIKVRYPDGKGILRQLLQTATRRGFAIEDVTTESIASHGSGREDPALVEVTMHIHGKGQVHELAAEMSEVDGVSAVVAGDANAVTD